MSLDPFLVSRVSVKEKNTLKYIDNGILKLFTYAAVNTKGIQIYELRTEVMKLHF
jgi:hypothetical protein